MGAHFERGQALFDLKRYREAAEEYRAELAENPDSAVVHAVLAAALINLREIRDANKEVRRALELAPDMSYAYYILSFVHQNYRRLADAEKAIVEALRLTQSPDSLHQWALIAEQRGKFDDALKATEQALRLDPRHNASILVRGRLLARLGKRDEAHALFVSALSHNPQDAAAQHALGSLQLRTGDAAMAIRTLREARRLDPITSNDPDAIALAYGQLLWPLCLIDPLVFRWYVLPHKKQWAVFSMLGLFLATIGTLVHSHSNDATQKLPWLAICILLGNYLVFPFSFEMIASAAGHLALRREFRTPWYKLILRPLIVFPALCWHLAGTFIGFLAGIPALAIIGCLGMASSPLLLDSVRTSAARLTGWLCLPLFFVLMIIGTFGAVMLELVAIPAGLLVLAPVFTIAYFSDNIVAWTISIRFRRNPHLL